MAGYSLHCIQKSENDPPETPYKSSYAARKVLRELHGLLATELDLGYTALETASAPTEATEGESTAASSTEDQSPGERSTVATATGASKATEDSDDNAVETSAALAEGKAAAGSSTEDRSAKTATSSSESKGSECLSDTAPSSEQAKLASDGAESKMPKNVLSKLVTHI